MPNKAWTPERLHRSADFERVRQKGARWRGRFCALNAARALSFEQADAPAGLTAATPHPHDASAAITRVGYITSKKLGGAVKRNRARRLMREAIRALAVELPAGWDLVLIAQNAIVADDVRMPQVRDDIRWLVNKAIAAVNTAKSHSTPSRRPPASGTPSSAAS
jgi:ribonuclease P protein component